MKLLDTINLNRTKIKLIQAFEAKAMERIKELHGKVINLSIEINLLKRKASKLEVCLVERKVQKVANEIDQFGNKMKEFFEEVKKL